jgi:hypothetical protein
MSRLDAFFGRIRAAGVDLALGFGINFSTGLSAVRNPSTKYVDVTASIAATNVAPAAADMAVPFVIGPIALTLGFGGVAIDTAVLVGAPFAFTILDMTVIVSAAPNPTCTAVLRSATGGGGTALSSTLTLNAAGTFRNNDTQTRAVTAGGDLYLRRSTDVNSSVVYLLAVRT